MITSRRLSPPPFLRFFAFGALALVIAVIGISPIKAQASPRLQQISERGTLRVCIWPGYFSITYRNPRNGILEGIDIDLAQEFANDLGVSVQFVDSSFPKLISNLQDDVCDIAMHAVGVRPDRAEHVDFSVPYLISGIYGVTPRTHPTLKAWADIDKPGHVVVVQKGTYMEPVMRDLLKQATLRVVDDFKEREQEVESGRADVFMTDYPYGRRMVTQTPWAALIEPPTPLAPTPYAYAVPKGDAAWLARVDAFVAAIKADGRLKTYAQKHGLLPIAAVK
jgi:ABC-type amino acid transport substrate-binding protein